MKYTESHEWIDIKDGFGIVGVTHFAQKELGDIVYVELPIVGKKIKKGEEVAVLESTKAAADVYTPVSGTIVEVNTSLSNESSLVNRSPEKEGWIFKLSLEDLRELDSLMKADEYHAKFL